MSAEELITQHLDLWTGAVTHKSGAGRGRSGRNGKIELTGIKKLRELVLELAVRGKLVEQDPNDEPASVLLERIAKEKARLVKEGKIKKQKNQIDVDPRQADFELPSRWSWTRLGSIGQVLGGGTPKSGEPSYWADRDVTWLTPADLYSLNEKHIESGKRDISKLGLEKSSAQILPKGSVLFSSRAPIGYVAIAAKELATNQGFKSCVPYICDTNQFIYYFLKRSSRLIDASASGTTFKEVSGATVASIAMPLPPLAEQHRIVEKVDELMALCDRLEQQVGDQLEAHEVLVDTLLGTLTRSTNAAETAENWARIAEHFDTLFTTEASIEKIKHSILDLAATGRLISFCNDEHSLKSILSFGPRNGLSPKECNYSTACKVLKLGATTKGKLDLNKSKNVDVNLDDSSHLWIRHGDILIQRGNAAMHVGCNVMIGENHHGFIYPDLMMKIRVKKEADPRFISIQISAPKSRKFMWNRMTGTSGTMPKISKKIVEAIPIILPDMETQQITINKVDELMALCDRLKDRLGEAGDTRAHLAEAVVKQAVS